MRFEEDRERGILEKLGEGGEGTVKTHCMNS